MEASTIDNILVGMKLENYREPKIVEMQDRRRLSKGIVWKSSRKIQFQCFDQVGRLAYRISMQNPEKHQKQNMFDMFCGLWAMVIVN